MAELASEAVADVGAFLARLVRLDPGALVRLRPTGPEATALWARLPFDVLATRLIRSPLAEDATVRAGELLAALERGETALPGRHDVAWRSPLPPEASEVVERVPAAEVRRVALAAAATIRAAVASLGVGERRLRDELLDHVAMIVTHGDRREEVPVRLVQGVVRMGFLGADDTSVRVRAAAGGWLGLEATYGCAWRRVAPGLRLLS